MFTELLLSVLVQMEQFFPLTFKMTDIVNAFQLCFACGSGLQLARNAGEFMALWLCSKGVNREERGRYSTLTEYGNNNNYKANQQEVYS